MVSRRSIVAQSLQRYTTHVLSGRGSCELNSEKYRKHHQLHHSTVLFLEMKNQRTISVSNEWSKRDTNSSWTSSDFEVSIAVVLSIFGKEVSMRKDFLCRYSNRIWWQMCQGENRTFPLPSAQTQFPMSETNNFKWLYYGNKNKT